MPACSSTHLRELADFIRVRRDRLSPESCGLDGGNGRRRTPGLRRDELGRLAGLSADWIAWLEQGRDIRLSTAAAERLARALRLDAVEAKHLLALAQGRATEETGSDAASRTLRAIVDAQGANPAYVADGLGNLKAWNTAAGLVFDDFGRVRLGQANLLRFMFLYEEPQRSIVDWKQYARRMVAQFRLRHDRAAGDDRYAVLAGELCRASELFESLWAAHEVARRSTGRKTIQHASLGELTFDYCNFQVEEAPDLTLTLHVPAPECGFTRQAMQHALSGIVAQSQP